MGLTRRVLRSQSTFPIGTDLAAPKTAVVPFEAVGRLELGLDKADPSLGVQDDDGNLQVVLESNVYTTVPEGLTIYAGFDYDVDLDTEAHGIFFVTDASPGSLECTELLPGDADLNGVVDSNDFIAWNTHKFQAGTDWASGDFNGDRTTDGEDFLIWNNYKFQDGFTGESVCYEPPSSAVVPEPTGLVLAVFAVVMLCQRRSRQ